ncbi:MAG: patatin-like phospholipase family protein [Deltaproteobacteria bacterium]|nr:patatin-like phospholipase family protein [Deltaproteobacteria bacterium]
MSYKIGLALGGGGVRGLANIGVLLALEEDNIIPKIIAGTSMGAIVGSVYADTTSAVKTKEVIKGYLGGEEFQKKAQRLSMLSDMDKGFLDRLFVTAKKGYFYYRTLFRKSVISPEAFFMEMDRLIPDKQFSELKLAFACVALDIVSGYSEILHSGPIRPAIRASSAVPGILPPVEIEDRRYVDGGWVESVPVSAARFLKADFIIGVDVSREIIPINYHTEIKNSMDILYRADDIARSIMNTYRIRGADFVIHPDVGSAHWSDFDNMDAYISSGYRATKDAVPALKKAIRVKRIKSILWKKR